jgi:hypothetical protein
LTKRGSMTAVSDPSEGTRATAESPVPSPAGGLRRPQIPRYVLALVGVLVFQIVFLAAGVPALQPRPRPDVYFSSDWGVSGCIQNATYWVTLNYTGHFANINGPDAYVVLGLYVNHLLRLVSTHFVPRGAWAMSVSGSAQVSCATFRTAALVIISTVAA